MANTQALDVLHIASFHGNVGDNANHNGTRRKLKENTSYTYEYSEDEIRKYYQNYKADDALFFDDDFVNRANDNDVVLIGGGNFFELWIEESNTGTTIDLHPEYVDQIEVPIIFYGLGCDPYKGVPGNNREKFQEFLDHILAAEHCLVSVRNDGSMEHIRQLFGSKYADEIYKVPDGGFFTDVGEYTHPELSDENCSIAINITKDMVDNRFSGTGPNAHTYESFLAEFAGYVDDLLKSNPHYEVVFMPHIYSDLEAISDLLKEMDNMNRRSRITTAPYLNGEGSEKYIFNIYRQSNLSMGMRFHTNVCSIGQHTPSIGLVSYPKVDDLYNNELSLPSRTVDLKQKGFANDLREITDNSLHNQTKIQMQYEELCDSLQNSLSEFHNEIDYLLNEYY